MYRFSYVNSKTDWRVLTISSQKATLEFYTAYENKVMYFARQREIPEFYFEDIKPELETINEDVNVFGINSRGVRLELETLMEKLFTRQTSRQGHRGWAYDVSFEFHGTCINNNYKS